MALMLLLVPGPTRWDDTFPSTAAAIAEAASEDPLWPPEDNGVARTAAILLAFGFTESRYRPDAVDPSGFTFGLFQVSRQWGTRKSLLDPATAAQTAIRLLRESMRVCAKRPEAERWAWFTDGTATCPVAGYRRSAWRHGIAVRLLRDYPPDSD